MRFLLDTQLPMALARWLAMHGHEATHVLEVGLAQSTDNPIWLHAEKTHAVIVTKDEDFAHWVVRGRPGPAVVWLRSETSPTARFSCGWSLCCR